MYADGEALMLNSEANKAWIAAIMAMITIADLYFATSLSITEEWITTLLLVLSPILVWLIPNR
jgi:small-conductance mechanosensitive channel